MKLSNEQLKAIYYGAIWFDEDAEGYLHSYQYTQPQIDYFKEAFDFWYERCTASSAKTLEFTTTATKVSFDYKIIWIGSMDSIELSIDGLPVDIRYVKDLEKEGRISFELPEGSKDVVIYLPADATILLKNAEINGEYTPAKKGEKVLWLGDSITQGFGPLRSFHTYVSAANRQLNYDIVNQGIGGYVYDKNSLMDMGVHFDKLIVALGTNQHGDPTMDACEEYYERLFEIYGTDIPVLCITPLWRGDTQDDTKALQHYCEGIRQVCAKYKNITIVEGWKLVPHLPEYYLDNLHPNCIGTQLYADGLVEAIRRTGF